MQPATSNPYTYTYNSGLLGGSLDQTPSGPLPYNTQTPAFNTDYTAYNAGSGSDYSSLEDYSAYGSGGLGSGLGTSATESAGGSSSGSASGLDSSLSSFDFSTQDADDGDDADDDSDTDSS